MRITRDKLFISYSHQDEAFLAALEPWLKVLTDRDLVETWSDKDIHPGHDWHHKIQQAIDSAAAALLLVSQDFLASDYIREHEVPQLLEAREREGVPIACLFLHTSLVDHDQILFPAPGKAPGQGVKLTRYQGLNSPGRPLDKLESPERDEIYKATVEWLLSAMPGITPKRMRQPRPEDRRELTVRLSVTDGWLLREYLANGSKLTEYRSRWSSLAENLRGRESLDLNWFKRIGKTLYQVLFGDTTQDQSAQVLATVFEVAQGVQPRPILHPVRVRLETVEPLLQGLPWHLTAWEGKRLWESAGWTFELVSPAVGGEHTVFANQLLKAPCPVLLIELAPRESTSFVADPHFQAVRELLHRAWPAYSEPPRVATDDDAIRRAFEERRPRIIYAYGAGTDPQVDSAGGPQPLAEALRTAWANHPPQVLLVNLAHAGVWPGWPAARDLHPAVPLVACQCWPEPVTAERSALEWLHEMLEGGEDLDPVCALHQYGADQAVVWGNYQRWNTRTSNEPPREHLARLLLDRKLQRSVVNHALVELVHEGDRRLCCLFAYGSGGNLVERLGDQLFEHLRRTAHKVAHLRRLPLRLPADQDFDVAAITAQVHYELGLGPRESLEQALGARRPNAPSGRRPVIFLDWGVRGKASSPISGKGITAWLEFCAGPLVRSCPPELRLLSLLALETPTLRHARVSELVDALRGQARFRDRAFRVERLEPLDSVTANDLADFLDRKGSSSCPDDLVADMPELIVSDTRGEFERTVVRIEEAERRTWYALYDELSARREAAAAAPLQGASDDLVF